MSNKFTKLFLSTLFLFLIISITAKGLNLHSLQKEIIHYNRAGKHYISQKKLSEVLLKGNLSDEEKANISFLFATTYRSVNDYSTCIDYLKKTEVLAKNLPKDNLLRIKLDYEYAFVYFDNNEYQKAAEAMKKIDRADYINPSSEDYAYITMQKGYLLLLDNKYGEAEKKYIEALDIMKLSSPCNLPVVYTKIMNLYAAGKKISKAEEIYRENLRICDSCNVLKYSILASSEMERIYKENNLYGQAYLISSRLDSLRRVDNQENKISEMHLVDRAYVEREQIAREKSEVRKGSVILVILILPLFLSIYYFYKKNKRIKKDRVKLREEISQIKEELDSYSQSSSQEKFVSSCEDLFPNFEQLTDRQKELVELLSQGLSNKEIAEKLFITENTVKYHTKNIYNILNVKDRKDFFQMFKITS